MVLPGSPEGRLCINSRFEHFSTQFNTEWCFQDRQKGGCALIVELSISVHSLVQNGAPGDP